MIIIQIVIKKIIDKIYHLFALIIQLRKYNYYFKNPINYLRF